MGHWWRHNPVFLEHMQLGSFSQSFSIYITRPEHRVAGSQKRSDLSIQPAFLIRVDSTCSGGGNIIHTLTNVAGDNWCILLQIHLSSVCCCFPENLPVSTSKALLKHRAHWAITITQWMSFVLVSLFSAQGCSKGQARWKYDQRDRGGGGGLLCNLHVCLCTHGQECCLPVSRWWHAGKTHV